MHHYEREGVGTSLIKGLAAGMIGGLAASWIMNQFQSATHKVARKWEESSQPSGQAEQQSQGEQQQQGGQESESATVKTAEAISTHVAHRHLTPRQKQIAGPLVHYTYGTMLGGVYGATAQFLPITTLGNGLTFGAIAWLAGDEIAVPLFGLGSSPTETPVSTHAEALSAHLVYGMATDSIRRIVLTIL